MFNNIKNNIMPLTEKELRNIIEDYLEKELKTTYKRYSKLSTFGTFLIIFLKLLVFIPPILVSGLAAFNENIDKIYLITLPLVNTVATAILLKFRIAEIWKLREHGRIATKSLYEKSKRILITADSKKELEDLYENMVEEASEIEKEQSQKAVDAIASTKIIKRSKN